MDKKSMKKIGLGTLAAVVCVVVIGGVYYLGYTKGMQETRNIIVQGVSDPLIAKDGIDFKPFWEAWSVVQDKFVTEEKATDGQALLYGAISGMVEALGDPNTNFLAPQRAEEFNQEISGEFSGIGAEIGLNEDRRIVIIAPLQDTPAYKAGIQPGDIVYKIDGTETNGFTVEEAVSHIRGPRGTSVSLSIIRGGEELAIDITRDIIVLPTLEMQRLDRNGSEDQRGDIVYIKLYNFYEKAPSQFRQAAIRAASGNTKGIILDLRNNPGGYLEAAIQIAGWFVPRGETVVREEFRDDSLNDEFYSSGPSILKDIPTVVLVNRGSASASEILAGALQEQVGARIVGEQSFGKGTVQELVPLMDDSLLKITIAHWLTPQGRIIDRNGITPDVTFEPVTEAEGGGDVWLVSARHELLKLIK